jgi:transcriptional antiterminator RfaH
MPTLPEEPDFFPGDLFDAPPAPASGRGWHVAHTRPRQEKALARQLLAHRVPFYLPTAPRTRRSRGKTIVSRIPLFTSYVFLLANDAERIAALTTQRVLRAIEPPDQAGLWRDLRQVRQLVESGLPVFPEDRLAPGAPVEIKNGPLAGLRGRILSGASGRRFVVQVDFIQRGAAILIDQHALEVTESPPEPDGG